MGTISYFTLDSGNYGSKNHFGGDEIRHDTAIISTVHPYLDLIDPSPIEQLGQEALTETLLLGILLSKVGEYPDTLGESASPMVSQVNELGMAGVSLFSISQENCWFRGELKTRVAEELYL